LKLTIEVSDGMFKVLQIRSILDDTTPEQSALWILQEFVASELDVDELYTDWIKNVTKVRRPSEEQQEVEQK
jgi:hypothetical protein